MNEGERGNSGGHEGAARGAEEKGLSEREQQILRLVATGASNKEIAHQLVISTNTVKVHLRNIFVKIDVMSRTEATVYAIRAGLVLVGEVPNVPPVAEDAADAAEPEAAPAAQAGPAEPAQQLPWWRRLGWVRLGAAAGAGALLLAATAAAGALTLGPLAASPTPTGIAQPPAVTPSAAPTLSRWRPRAPLPTPRGGLAVVSHEGRVYGIAGESASGPTGAAEAYDPNSDRWQALTPKPVAVADVGAAVIGGRIYVPGGRLASGAVTSTVEMYNPAADVWERRAPLPAALSAYAIAAFEGRLFVFGGWDGKSPVATAYEYDPSRDAWTSLAPMPTARAFAGAAVAGGKVYVLGGTGAGEAALTVNEEFTPGQGALGPGTWAERAPMAGEWVEAGGCGMVSVVDGVHVFGGGGDARVVRVYNFRTDSWDAADAPSAGGDAVRGCGAALVGTHVYLVGGDPAGDPQPTMEYQAAYLIILPGGAGR